jgi:dihydroorotase
MRDALIYCQKFDIPVINHCEILALSQNGVIHQGKVSKELGLTGIPDSAESIMVLRDILLAEQTGGWVHIAHVSTKKSVEIIRWAKRRGIRVTAETCPHYFTLTDKDCLSLNTNYKVSPPLRTKADIEAIKQGLADSMIDAIATDHAPWHTSFKNKTWPNARSVMIGFETAFSLGYQELVLKKYLGLEKYLACLTTKPAQILKQSAEIKKESPAVLTIFNLNKTWIQTHRSIISKSKNSPFINKKLKGKITRVIVKDKIFTSD